MHTLRCLLLSVWFAVTPRLWSMPAAQCIDVYESVGQSSPALAARAASRPVKEIAPRPEFDAKAQQLAEKHGLQIIEVLGEGGFGRVYLTLDPRTGALAAIKVGREVSNDRNEREIGFANRLFSAYLKNHPELIDDVASRAAGIPVLKPGAHVPFFPMASLEMDGHSYPKMPAVGTSLAKQLHQFGSQSDRIDDTHRVANKIVDAVVSAEREGIILQDVKPGNILVDADHDVQLVDFGLTADLHDDVIYGIAGTPGYMKAAAYDRSVPAHGDDVTGVQQTLRNLYLGRTADQLAAPLAGQHYYQKWDRYFSDYHRSPRTIDRRVPESISVALWLPFKDVAQFEIAWKKAQEFAGRPGKFYEWLRPTLEKLVEHDASQVFQRLASSQELLDARREGKLRLSRGAEAKLRAARAAYSGLSVDFQSPGHDPLPIIEIPAGL